MVTGCGRSRSDPACDADAARSGSRAPVWPGPRSWPAASWRRPVRGRRPRHRRSRPRARQASVVAEDELVEVDGQVLVRDASIGPVHPCLEVGARPVHPGQRLLFGRQARVLARALLVAELGQTVVGAQSVGVDDRPRGRRRLRERRQRLRLRVGQHCRRKRPDPCPRSSITAATRAFLPCWRLRLRPSHGRRGRNRRSRPRPSRARVQERPAPGAASARSARRSHSA
jgi:hypothetical protein